MCDGARNSRPERRPGGYGGRLCCGQDPFVTGLPAWATGAGLGVGDGKKLAGRVVSSVGTAGAIDMLCG